MNNIGEGWTFEEAIDHVLAKWIVPHAYVLEHRIELRDGRTWHTVRVGLHPAVPARSQ